MSSRLLSEEERNEIVREIMSQNEAILSEHRKKLELEFQHQLREVLSNIDPESCGLHESKPSTPVDVSAVNEANAKFFQAAQEPNRAPQIQVYDGDRHSATVRASQEVTPMGSNSKPVVVSSASSKVVGEEEGVSMQTTKKSRIPPNLAVYNQPYARKSRKEIQRMESDKSLKHREKQRSGEIEEKLRSQEIINRVPSPDGRVCTGDEVDSLMYRVAGTTKSALLKSSALLKDISSHNKKVMKKYKHRPSSCGNEKLLRNSPKRSEAQKEYSGTRKSPSRKTRAKPTSKSTSPTAFVLPPVQKPASRGEDVVNDNAEEKEPKERRPMDPMYVTEYMNAHDEGEDSMAFQKGMFNDKRTWENQLARHILSVYATSQVENSKKSSAVLEFIDLKNTSSAENLVEEGLFDKKKLIEDKQSVDSEAKIRSQINGSTSSAADESKEDWNGDTLKSCGEKKAGKKKTKKKKPPFRQVETDPARNIGLEGTMTQKELKFKERDEVNQTKKREAEGNANRVGLVRAPAKCFPIWYTSSGDIYADWLALPDGSKLQPYLESLQEKKKYRLYLDTVGEILEDNWIIAFFNECDPLSKDKSRTLDTGLKKKKERTETPQRRRRMDVTEFVVEEDPPLSTGELKVHFRQLVLVANAFAILCVEKKDYDTAMLIIRTAEKLVGREEIFPPEIRVELKAYVNQSLAYYFYRTKKAGAALSHTNLALQTYRKVESDSDIATCLLHLSCCHFQVGKFKAAHKVLYDVLGMVDDGKIAFDESQPKELCLVAIAYHNLAVIQLKLQVPEVAAKSSQNARKIARLCLSYSNRWINTFHWTHQLCLSDVKYELENNFNLTEEQKRVMNELTKMLYEPMPN